MTENDERADEIFDELLSAIDRVVNESWESAIMRQIFYVSHSRNSVLVLCDTDVVSDYHLNNIVRKLERDGYAHASVVASAVQVIRSGNPLSSFLKERIESWQKLQAEQKQECNNIAVGTDGIEDVRLKQKISAAFDYYINKSKKK